VAKTQAERGPPDEEAVAAARADFLALQQVMADFPLRRGP
jgi:hypothetical protein